MKACLEYFRLMAIFRQMAVSAALPTCFRVTTSQKNVTRVSLVMLAWNISQEFFLFSGVSRSLSHDGCEFYVLDLLFFITNAG